MIDRHAWTAQSLGMVTPVVDAELDNRLGLYQVFLKLYEQHRVLLDEILDLENVVPGSSYQAGLHYVQGVVHKSQAYLVTNLMRGATKALIQPQQTWMIGRDRTAAIAIQDERLSRRHAAIQYVPSEGFYLFDLNSKNGSFINGERVRQVALLKEGDRVRLGSLAFTFVVCQTSQNLNQLPQPLLESLDQIRSTWKGKVKCSGTDANDWSVAEDPVLPASADASQTSVFLPLSLSGKLGDGCPCEQQRNIRN